jgi:hypothetical protein
MYPKYNYKFSRALAGLIGGRDFGGSCKAFKLRLKKTSIRTV